MNLLGCLQGFILLCLASPLRASPHLGAFSTLLRYSDPGTQWPHDAVAPVNPNKDETITSQGPIVETANGPVQGMYRGVHKKSITWWGIPFAEAPVGDLRFQAPQPLKRKWKAPLEAKKIPPSCTSVEDCLYLNVHIPAVALDNRTSPLPVMFWIYGGGYVSGDSYEYGLYDGQHLCEKHNVLVVSVNYRLGNLGFMALDALRKEDKHGSTGNYGVQDQTLGLRWVKQNIASFGGDPGRVTIFGESAGGFSVMWHLVSPASSGLFHGAIMESGTSQLSFFYQPYEDAVKYGEETAAILKCPASVGQSEQLKCLRALSMDSILHGTGSRAEAADKQRPANYSPLFPLMPVGPVIDGTWVGTPDTPAKLVEAGRFNKVPLILGSNENGGTIFEPMLPALVPDARWPATIFNESVGKAFDHLLGSDSSQFQKVYNVTEYRDGKAMWPEDALLSRAVRDLVFMCPLRQIATQYARHGLPAYMYVFQFNYGYLVDKILHLGDFHASELPFVFKNFLWAVKAIAENEDPQLMSDIMSCKWTSFAYTQDPNGGSDESKWPPGCEDINRQYNVWPQFTLRDRLFYNLKVQPQVLQIRSDNYFPDDTFPRDPKCDLVDSLSAKLQFIHRNGLNYTDEIIV